MTVSEIFEAHVKTHKVTPGQQVNLLIFYLGLRMLLPKITLAEYLHGALQVAGANKENLAFPKDALDQYCPNKDSAWTPDERVEIMMTYLSLLEIGAAEQFEVQPFQTFLATESVIYKGGVAPAAPAVAEPVTPVVPQAAPAETPPFDPTPATPPAGEAAPTLLPPGMTELPPTTGATPARNSRKKAAAAVAYVAGVQCSYRAPNGPVLAGRIASVINNIYTFAAESGELLSGITDVTLFEPLDDAPPELPTGGVSQRMILAAHDANESEGYLQSTSAIPTKAIGEVLKTSRFQVATNMVFVIDIINAQPRPSIDAYVLRDGIVVAEIPPREMSVYGNYTFTVDSVVYQVEVSR